jgi:hypothetical protein
MHGRAGELRTHSPFSCSLGGRTDHELARLSCRDRFDDYRSRIPVFGDFCDLNFWENHVLGAKLKAQVSKCLTILLA